MTLTVPVVVTIREALSQFLKQVLSMERGRELRVEW